MVLQTKGAYSKRLPAARFGGLHPSLTLNKGTVFLLKKGRSSSQQRDSRASFYKYLHHVRCDSVQYGASPIQARKRGADTLAAGGHVDERKLILP